jgi:radical SAM superfamily enzyme YgiQ (UPF0313 family)
MRVLLVHPDFKRATAKSADTADGLLPARSLIELGGVLSGAGHRVTVLDSFSARAREQKDPPDMDRVLSIMLEEEDFDAVGISVCTPLRKEAHEMARTVKRHSGSVPVILGGPHTARMAGTLLDEWREIDYVCLGAAERTLPVLLDNIASGKRTPNISGIAYRTGRGLRQAGKPLIDAELESLPPVRYDSYLEEIPADRIKRAYIMTSRGCVNWCNFCSKIWKKFLPDRPDKVADELAHLVRDCGTEEVIIYDDCFGKKKEHALAVLDAIIEKDLDVGLQTVTTFEAISRDWLRRFKQAGGKDVLVGLETGSARLRKKMNKHLTEEEIISAVLAVRTAGLRLGIYLMFGFHREELQDITETYRMVDKIDPDQVMSSVYDVKPGDLLFEFAVTSGDLRVREWKNDNNRIVNYMSDEEKVRNAARAAYFDRRFTREVLVPEHDRPADFLGIDDGRLEELIGYEKARLEKNG